MIGRAAQGRPWIFREIDHYIKTGEHLPPPSINEVEKTTIEHVTDLYDFYGEDSGLKIARKHISWYTKGLKNSAMFRAKMNLINDNQEQLNFIKEFFESQKQISNFISYEDILEPA